MGVEGNDYTQEALLPGGPLQLFYKVWKENGCHPRVVHILQHGYEIILKDPIELARHPTIHSGYANQQKQNFLLECVQQMLQKKAVIPVRMSATLGFHSRLFLVPKPGKKWRPVIDLSVLNSHLTVPTFKMETAEVIRNSICKGEWVVSVDLTDAYFHIPIHQRSQSLLRFHVGGRSFQFKALPFGIATAPLEFTRVVKEVKLMLQNRGIRIHQYLDDWLLRAPTQQICMEQSKQLVEFVQELGWVINFKKSELTPTQKFDFLGYRFDLVKGEVLPTEKKWQILKNAIEDLDNSVTTTPRILMSFLAALEKTVPMGRLHMRPFQWYLKTHWKYPQSLDKIIPCSQILKKTSHMVERSKKCFDRVSPTCRGAQSPVVYRCFGQGLGSTFGRPDSQWTVVRHRDKFAYKHSGTKSSVSSNKVFSNPFFEQESLGGLRQFNSGGLPQQTGGDSFTRNVSHVMASHGFLSSQSNFAEGSTHSGLSQCDSRQPLTQGQGHTDRMVSSSQNFSKDLPNLAQTNDRLVCHQNEQQATPICVSSPRSKCNGGRCIEHLLGGNGRLCLLSNSSNSQSSPKDEVLCMSNDCSGPRVARDELVLGSHRPVHKTSTVSSTLGVASEATIQSKIPSKPSLSQSSCLASGLETKSPQKFSSTVAERIKAPQRFSSRRVYESRWSIFESWGKEKQVEFEQPSISTIADFLIHLFNEKNLKPTTIAGNRTAIADHLGPAGNDISHSFELNRLIASFHRDRPVKDRGVPSWDLSLVLLALTKSPFEPLKDAPLKLLTFKTVFLMTLASGRRRGEVHAWTFKSLKHKAGWKEVTVAPSSVFLSKNQLASDGPNVVQPVVIPALKPILDSSLSQDMTLCPVRSLRYYVDKTKDIRDGKHLLFVSFKNGFSGDIQRATISSWIKQTVILAYQESDLETQKLSRVKAHDVRSMAASLAFKGGVSLDQILGACFWKSHTTFTNFYLKDVSWKSKEGAEYSLGSVVSAQHIVHL